MTIYQAKIYIQKELSGLYPKNEITSFIKIIFSDVFSTDSVQLITNEDHCLTETYEKKLNDIVSRLLKFEPLQYIIGHTEFYGLKIYVDKHVLIPRSETEELIDMIIKETGDKKGVNILDIGTGSGCIAVALAKHLPEASVCALDISKFALETARKNASENNVQLTFIQWDILSKKYFPENQKFDIIVSNPPYVRNSEKLQMEKNVLDWEPELALFVEDDDPLVFYRVIAEFAKDHLTESGKLYFEINEAFGKEVKQVLSIISFENIQVFKDINKKERIVKATLNTQDMQK